MKDALGLNIGGLKCDAPSCDYNDMTIKVEDYPEWVNKPCPKCGSNLLTEADYQTVQNMLKFVEAANKTLPKRPEDDKDYVLPMSLDGSGQAKVDENVLRDLLKMVSEHKED